MKGLSYYDTGYLAGLIVGALIGIAFITLISVFFLLNLQNTLKQCAPQNQKMKPSHVWFSLIPIFSYYWQFKVVAAVADSLAAEFHSRNFPAPETRPGYNLGMAYCILLICSFLQYAGMEALGNLCGIAGFICWIIYWVRTARYKRDLAQHQFQFGTGNPNPYQFPNQFPGQH